MDLQIQPLQVILFIPFLFLLITLLHKYCTNSSPCHLPSGPRRLPIIGNIHQLAFTSFPHRTLRDLARRHGPQLMYLRLGQVDNVVVSSREAAEEVMKSQDLNFAYRPQLAASRIMTYDYTDIAFSPYGAYWRQLRKICIIELLSSKRVKSFASIRADETMKMMRAIAADLDRPVRVSELLIELTNGIVSRASFGERCPNPLKFMKYIREAMYHATGFSVADLFPSLRFLDLLSGQSYKINRIHGVIDEMLDAIIKDHQLSRKDGEDEEHEDLIDVLLKCKDRDDLELPLTLVNIKAVITDIFSAGTDTSASTMDWAMAELIRHPEVMKKTQREVREIMEGKTKIDDTDISKMEYLKSVIKETLRLHPPLPLLVPREAKKTCKVLDYTIRAKTRVLVNVWALNRDPQYWEDTEIFKPERFMGSTVDFKGKDFEFVPFGAGRRICPGLTFANVNIEFGLAHLLFYFDWCLPYGMQVEELDMTETFGATVSKKIPLHLIATMRYPLPVM